MNKSKFTKSDGIEAYNEVIAWNREINDVCVYDCLEDIEEDYDISLIDAEDVFQHFGYSVRAVMATGEFLIDKKFFNRL